MPLREIDSSFLFLSKVASSLGFLCRKVACLASPYPLQQPCFTLLFDHFNLSPIISLSWLIVSVLLLACGRVPSSAAFTLNPQNVTTPFWEPLPFASLPIVLNNCRILSGHQLGRTLS